MNDPLMADLSLIVRVLAALAWTGVFIRVLMGDYPYAPLLRHLVVGTLVAVLWGVVLRGAVVAGLIEEDHTLVMFTAVTFIALIVGVTLLSLDIFDHL